LSIFKLLLSSFFRLLIIMVVMALILPADLRHFSCLADSHAFTVRQEREYGQKMLTTVRQQFDLIEEIDIVQYINDLGQQILAVAGPQFFHYRFYVIDNKDFNAFAAPSGLIFIHSGIIDAMKTEGELVSVMAHECGHVMSRHIARRLAKSKKTSAATMAMVLAGIAVGGGPLSQALVTGGVATGAALDLKFSRQDEEEADRIAFSLMNQLHRDPHHMLSMLTTMFRENRLRTIIPPYLLTHPQPEMRMAYVEDLININPEIKWPAADKFAFMRIKMRIAQLAGDPRMLMGRYRKKLRTLTAGDERIMVRYGLALTNYDLGYYNKAIEHLKFVIGHYPMKTNLVTDLGRVYLAAGDLNQAISLFEDVRKKEPANIYNSHQLALALIDKNDFDRGQKLLLQISGQLPELPAPYRNLARLASRQQDIATSHYYLGLALYYEGETDNSGHHLQKARELLAVNHHLQKEINDFLARINKDK